MKYILSFIVAITSFTLAQTSTAPVLTTNLLFNGTGTNVVSKFYTDSAFVANISGDDESDLFLFSAKTGQKIMDFVPGQVVPYTGEFFFIVHSPAVNSSWQINVENQSYIDSLNQARQESLASSNGESTSQALASVLSFEGRGNNSTTEFFADKPFVVNFNQDSGVQLYLYSGTNRISTLEHGQTVNYTGQFYIYVDSPNQDTSWRIDLNNIN